MALDKKPNQEETNHLPEDLLCQKILPRLPYKLLSRLKSVSKAHLSLLAPKTYFATLQSRSPSPISTGFVYVNGTSLSFLPNQDSIGVPDPSLEFMVNSLEEVKLLAVANGLLLFYLFGGLNSLCVCNPATKEKTIIPQEEHHENFRREMGLAFDPCVSPEQYAVINPFFKTSKSGIEYSFNVFSSQTGKWTCSKQKVFMPNSLNAPIRPVYALGLVYWSCFNYLLWFDSGKDCAGTIPLPYFMDFDNVRQEIVVLKDEIVCMCITSGGGIEVWKLIGQIEWNRLYELSPNTVIHDFSPDLFLGLPSDEMAIRCIFTSFSAPLAFDGRNVYLAVSMEWHLVKDWLISNKKNEFKEDVMSFIDKIDDDDSLFSDTEIAANDGFDYNFEDLVYCDMVTGKLVHTGKGIIRTDRNFRIFYYHNSMVAVPPISK